jgi:hypothetical protein
MMLRLVEGLVKRTAMAVMEFVPSYDAAKELNPDGVTPGKVIRINAVALENFEKVVQRYAPRIKLMKPGTAVDKKTGGKNRRVKLVGMVNGKEAMAILRNKDEIILAAKVEPSNMTKISRYARF